MKMKLLDRVNVTTIKFQPWHSVNSLINGYVAEIYPDKVKVLADEKSSHTGGFMGFGGLFCLSSFIIEPFKNE